MRTSPGIRLTLLVAAAATGLAAVPASAQTPGKKPNILIIWGDDIGYWNVSAYNQGMMGYKTPNIDRIAKEEHSSPTGTASSPAPPGARPSSRASRASAPACSRSVCPAPRKDCGARRDDRRAAQGPGLQDRPVRQEPSRRPRRAPAHRHGFDEFYGSLYHLNAEDEPEHPDYFKDPEMQKKYATRGVLHTWANPDGTQKIELTGR